MRGTSGSAQDPAHGARILFFSGGTALRGLAPVLAERTHRSRHIVTPFDSGGSSAELRDAFRMPAVGDLRNRLMALADMSVPGNREVHDLLAFRFPWESEQLALSKLLDVMVAGQARQIRDIPEPTKSTIREHLEAFCAAKPDGFDLRGASVGNLVLTGGYLAEGRRLEPVLRLFSRLVGARGIVRPVVDDDLHLAARLADGSVIVGQHRMTGKEVPGPTSPIERLFLTRPGVEDGEGGRARLRDGLDDGLQAGEHRPVISDDVRDLIVSSDLVCYPVGSFYTSLIANLLPAGVSDAVAKTEAIKLYVPNPSHDPEEAGMDLVDKVATLLRYLADGASGPVSPDRLLNAVLVDAERSRIGADALRRVRELGVDVLEAPLVSRTSAPHLDDELWAEALLSLA